MTAIAEPRSAGFPMPEHYPDYPLRRQLRDYIRSFARTYGLYDHITVNAPVETARLVDGEWRVTVAGNEHRYRALIAAPGVTWHPNRPDFPGLDTFRGQARHSVTYRHPDEFRHRRVLIIGGGNSGADIACDAARNADAAYHRFGEMAQLVAIDLSVAGSEKARFRHLKSSHYPDLRSSMQYLDSPRHASYVETHTYQHVLAEIREPSAGRRSTTPTSRLSQLASNRSWPDVRST